MGFSRSHNNELNSVVRGTSAADTPMWIQQVGPAASRRTKARPKRLNGLFYWPRFILGRSTGQIRRMGGRKTRQKHQTNSIRLSNYFPVSF